MATPRSLRSACACGACEGEFAEPCPYARYAAGCGGNRKSTAWSDRSRHARRPPAPRARAVSRKARGSVGKPDRDMIYDLAELRLHDAGEIERLEPFAFGGRGRRPCRRRPRASQGSARPSSPARNHEPSSETEAGRVHIAEAPAAQGPPSAKGPGEPKPVSETLPLPAPSGPSLPRQPVVHQPQRARMSVAPLLTCMIVGVAATIRPAASRRAPGSQNLAAQRVHALPNTAPPPRTPPGRA